MDRRTKIIATVFGLLVLYGLGDQIVYPLWIEPALTIDQRIAKRREELDKLVELEERVRNAKREYLELASRMGSMDVERIETDVRDRINKLIEKYKLQNTRVMPTSAKRVGKSDLKRMRVVVKADAPFEFAVGFLRDMAEMPEILRIENMKMSPLRSRSNLAEDYRVDMTVPVEIRILPQQKIPGRITDAMLKQPDRVVRHGDHTFASIWDSKLFWDYVPPVPLRVMAGRPLKVKVGDRASLSASASGGDKNYTYLWSPATRLTTPNAARTDVDTKDAFTENYTITVTDGSGATATADVRVSVEGEKVVAKPHSGPLSIQAGRDVNVEVGQRASLSASISGGKPPYRTLWTPSEHLSAPTREDTPIDTTKSFQQTYEIKVTDAAGDTQSATVHVQINRARWKNGKYLQLRMALLWSHDDERSRELMLYNSKQRNEEYYAEGDEFDGGDLVFVHPTGGVVRRMGEYFIYPIGGWVDQDIKLADADPLEYRWLIQAAERDRKLHHEDAPEATRKTEASEDATKDELAEKRDGKATPPVLKPQARPVHRAVRRNRAAPQEGPTGNEKPAATPAKRGAGRIRLPVRNPRKKPQVHGEPTKGGN